MSKFYTSKKFLVSVLTATVVIAGGAGAWDARVNQQNEVKKQAAATQAAAKAAEQKTYYTYKGVEGKTALELLKSQQKVDTKTYSFGDQVISINGLEGNGPKYWTFYLNGKMADVGAGAYQAKTGDTIEWKLEQL